MTPQERQLVDDLFDRLAKVEGAPRDPDAAGAIQDGLRKAPNAIYVLVQTVLLQDEALKRAGARIQELEQAHAPEQTQSGGFLDSMRDTIFGKDSQPRGSVPNVPPPVPSRPVWNSGQVLQQTQGQGQGQYDQAITTRVRAKAMDKVAMDKAATDKAAASASPMAPRPSAAAVRSLARQRQRRRAWSAARS
jgi:hypothetical protein